MRRCCYRIQTAMVTMVFTISCLSRLFSLMQIPCNTQSRCYYILRSVRFRLLTIFSSAFNDIAYSYSKINNKQIRSIHDKILIVNQENFNIDNNSMELINSYSSKDKILLLYNNLYKLTLEKELFY